MSSGQKMQTKKSQGKAGRGLGGGNKPKKVHREVLQGITKPSLRRLARRAGVKRIEGGVYEELRKILKERMIDIITDSLEFTLYRRGKLVLLDDIINGIHSATGCRVTYLESKKI